MNGTVVVPVQVRPCVLQINQAGAWRNALDFDAGLMPEEFLHHADMLLRLAGSDGSTMRVVMARRGENGRLVGSGEVLMRWTRFDGWKQV